MMLDGKDSSGRRATRSKAKTTARQKVRKGRSPFNQQANPKIENRHRAKRGPVPVKVRKKTIPNPAPRAAATMGRYRKGNDGLGCAMGLFRQLGDQLDLHGCAAGQLAYLETGAGGIYPLEGIAIDLVYGGEIV